MAGAAVGAEHAVLDVRADVHRRRHRRVAEGAVHVRSENKRRPAVGGWRVVRVRLEDVRRPSSTGGIGHIGR